MVGFAGVQGLNVYHRKWCHGFSEVNTLQVFVLQGSNFVPLPADSEMVKLFQIVCMKHLIFNLRYSDVTSVDPRAWNLEAWFSMFSFATLASNLELEQVADLLMKMLQLCHVEPTPELRVALEVASEKLQDAEVAGYAWSPQPLEVIQALE